MTRPVARRRPAPLAAVALVLAACGTSASDHGVDNDDATAPQRDQTLALFSDIGDDQPGCSVAVRHAIGVADFQFGLADLETSAPITADSIFDIGSVSKQMTGGVVAALVLDGTIDVDESVTDFFDGLPDGSDEVTLSDLVHHTSGLVDYTTLLDAELDEVTDADDALDALRATTSLEFEPGTEFSYNNSNYLLLAETAAIVGDTGFPELSEALVFEPLGMTASSVRDDQGDLIENQATGYEDVGDGFEVVSSSWRQTGDGAVHSTPLDVLRWAEVFIEPGSVDGVVGSQEWVDLMLSPGAVADDDGTDYGFGLSIGDGVIFHSGSWIGYSSYLAIRPDAGAAVALSCNIDEFDTDSLGVTLLDIWS